eukprot:COSAG02_NODE_2084_length_9892_cov_47.719085_2_plen_265_part_00
MLQPTDELVQRPSMMMKNTFALAVALVIGAATAQTGTLSSIQYDGAECVTRMTECGADDVNLPDSDTCGDSCDCAADDVTDKPADVVQWTSGECVTCSEADGSTECNYPFFDTSDDMYPAMVAQGADMAYAKVTCANGVATIEHFSDAECTDANKVSNADITTAMQAYFAAEFAGMPYGMGACINVDVDMMSGVNIEGSHCDEVTVMSMDEVRLASSAVRTHLCAPRCERGLCSCGRHASPPLLLMGGCPRGTQPPWRRGWCRT